MQGGRLIYVAALLPLATGCASGRSVTIHVSGTGAETAPCIAEADGRRISAADLPASARRWRGREVKLSFEGQTAYRCVGNIVYELQRAGFRRIGFLSEPEPAAARPKQ